MTTEDHIGENRCWPCTVTNAAVGLLVAWLPLAVALVNGDPTVVAGTVVWSVVVTGFTGYRLVQWGYLPLAEPVAKLTGLHGRIGPGADRGNERDAK